MSKKLDDRVAVITGVPAGWRLLPLNYSSRKVLMSLSRKGLPLARAHIEQIFPKLTPAQIQGELEVVHPSGAVETLVTIHRSGQFTGEVGTLSGQRSMFRVRATEPGKVIELDRQHMMALIQRDAELGEILTRAFILRRVELAAAGVGDVVLIGSTHSADTLRIKEFLMRNGHPYSYIDLERDPDVQNLLDSFHLAAGEIPVVIGRGTVVIQEPQ